MAPVVVVVGGVNTDMVVQTPHLPRPGETVGDGSFLTTPGGKGANQAVAAAQLGATVRLIGKVGVDSFGEAARDNLRRYGIDTAGLGRDPREPSGVALIFVDAAGENAIAVAPGANMALTADDVEAQEGLLAGAEVVVGQCEVPAEATSGRLPSGARPRHPDRPERCAGNAFVGGMERGGGYARRQ